MKTASFGVNIHLEELFTSEVEKAIHENTANIVVSYIQDNKLFSNALEKAKLMLQKVAKLNAGIVRTDLSWYMYDPLSDTEWSNIGEPHSLTRQAWQEIVLDFFEKYVEAAAENNLNICAILYKQPGWLIAACGANLVKINLETPKSTVEERKNYYKIIIKTKFVQSYGEYCEAVAKRLGSKVALWQLWNEPNNPLQNALLKLHEQPCGYPELVKRLLDNFGGLAGIDWKVRANTMNNIINAYAATYIDLQGRHTPLHAVLFLYGNAALRKYVPNAECMINMMTDNDKHWSAVLEAYYDDMQAMQSEVQPDGQFQHSIKVIGVDMYPGTWLLDPDPKVANVDFGWEALDHLVQRIQANTFLKGCRVAVPEIGFSCCGVRPTEGVADNDAQVDWIRHRYPGLLAKVKELNWEGKVPVEFINWYELNDSRFGPCSVDLSVLTTIYNTIKGIPLIGDIIAEAINFIALTGFVLEAETHFGLCYSGDGLKSGYTELQHVNTRLKLGNIELTSGDHIVLQNGNGEMLSRVAYGNAHDGWIEVIAPVVWQPYNTCAVMRVTVQGENVIALRGDNKRFASRIYRGGEEMEFQFQRIESVSYTSVENLGGRCIALKADNGKYWGTGEVEGRRCIAPIYPTHDDPSTRFTVYFLHELQQAALVGSVVGVVE